MVNVKASPSSLEDQISVQSSRKRVAWTDTSWPGAGNVFWSPGNEMECVLLLVVVPVVFFNK